MMDPGSIGHQAVCAGGPAKSQDFVADLVTCDLCPDALDDARSRSAEHTFVSRLDAHGCQHIFVTETSRADLNLDFMITQWRRRLGRGIFLHNRACGIVASRASTVH